jgi:hypothetical protein
MSDHNTLMRVVNVLSVPELFVEELQPLASVPPLRMQYVPWMWLLTCAAGAAKLTPDCVDFVVIL